jgi:hypothetical protein
MAEAETFDTLSVYSRNNGIELRGIEHWNIKKLWTHIDFDAL